MKTSYIFTFFIFILLINITFGQTTFDLNNYYLPNIKYSSLEADFSLNGKENSEKSIFSSRLNARYNNNIYTPKRVSNLSININVRPSFNKSKSAEKSERSSWVNDLSLTSRNKFYLFKNPKLFYGTDLLAKTHHQAQRSSTIYLEGVYLYKQTNISLPITFGWGRIENITEAWRAMRIYKEFNKLQILNTNITNQHILGFANKMAILRNTRYLDFRKARISQLQAIDDYFTSTGLIDQQNMQYFTTLNDHWLFGTNQTRLSGTTAAIGYKPTVSIVNKQITYENAAILSIQHHRAINQKWQFDFQFDLLKGTIHDADFKYLTGIWQTTTSAKISYYPTSRTTISTNIKNTVGNHGASLDHSIYLFYYISPKTRIQFNTHLRYRDFIKNKISFQYAVQFTHSFW